jgi:Zn-dependent peptidase ImmA (M78 family)/transcriptional regulator with XRE-family HTH domain
MMQIDQATLGKRLREARTNAGLSQEDVAQELGVPRTAVVHIEAGNRAVSTVELAELARVYHKPIADFFRESLTEEEDVLTAIGRIATDFEANPRVQRELEHHVELCQQGASLRRLLQLDSLSAPPAYGLSIPSSPWEAVQQGQAVAADERRRLGLGDNPIPDMADLITCEGIWASGTHLPDEVSGLFLRHSSLGMVILVNFGHRRARKRFSYAHEYAHSLLDRSSLITISRLADRSQLCEVRANAFAAAFLLPETGVMAFLAHRNKGLGSREVIPVYDAVPDELKMKVQATWRSVPGSQRVNYQLIALLAYHYGVSYQAACYRLRSIKFISENEMNELIAQNEEALQFLGILKMKDALEGNEADGDKKPDRELTREIVSLAVEAYNRELVSKAKYLELGKLLEIGRDDMLNLVQS